MSIDAFVLTRHWRDTSTGVQLELWLSSDDGPIQLIVPSQTSVFFIRQTDRSLVQGLLPVAHAFRIEPLSLKNSHGEWVCGVYCQQQKKLRELGNILNKHNIVFWEGDIRPVERFLMERFITSSLSIAPITIKSQPNYCRIISDKVRPVDYQPTLNVVSLDIETSMDASDLYSIAVYASDLSLVFMVGEPQTNGVEKKPLHTNAEPLVIQWCDTAKACLQQFLLWVERYDPDILIGWHVVQFDCWVLTQLCHRWQVPFTLGRAKQIPHWREDRGEGQGHFQAVADNDKNTVNRSRNDAPIVDGKRRYVTIPGRMILDGIELLRTAFYHFDSFSLQFVANELLGESKLIDHDNRGQAISDLFQHNKQALARYNLQDCQLVWDIFEKVKLLDFAKARSRLTGLPLDKMGGSVASFEYAYLPKLHRKGYVAPNLGELTSDIVSPGGYVMQSLPGLYRHVLVLDFKSLYPSIIRTFAIDPYAFWLASHQRLSSDHVVEGYNGAMFAREHAILPDIIKQLWQERDDAKAKSDQPLSQAIKIIMNSFYGVLGSTGCRFFDPRVCSSITLRGHDIIQQSQQWIERQGHQVIYGDTDSLFVWLGETFAEKPNANVEAQHVGQRLASALNKWWEKKLQKDYQIDSALEVEFETHYQDFFMPTIRGSEAGSKKRYAGLVTHYSEQQVTDIELVFKGLEAVRSDWTPLAKKFQQQLYLMIFQQQPYQQYIIEIVQRLINGDSDHELIYSKRLRRRVSDYEKSTPPHIKAAKKIQQYAGVTLARGGRIDYVITMNGPEPVEYRKSMIDYQHYMDKQLRPIADSILCFVGDSFEAIVNKQLNLL